MPLSIVTDEAPTTLQDSTAVPLGVMPVGVTVKYWINGGPGGGIVVVADVPVTVTTAVLELAPDALTAVNVYVVVVAGVTAALPVVSTMPTP